MKTLIKNIILLILIIIVAGGIAFMLFNAINSVKYNKEAKNPIVTFEVEGYGKIKIELYPDYAPNTVASFIKLVENGYYDGKLFHGTDGKSIVAGMELTEKEDSSSMYDEEGNVIEGAEPTMVQEVSEDLLRVSDFDKNVKPYVENDTTGTGGDETTDYKVSIAGEFVANGYEDNTLRFEPGIVGLYRDEYPYENLVSESYNSGRGLFFIETIEESSLNGSYAAFGKVIEGMDIINSFKSLPTQANEENAYSTAVESSLNSEQISNFEIESLPKITKATVETFGYNYGTPKYREAFDFNEYMSNLYLQYLQNQ